MSAGGKCGMIALEVMAMPQKQMSESLSVGLLLALTGGLLDAYS